MVYTWRSPAHSLSISDVDINRHLSRQCRTPPMAYAWRSPAQFSPTGAAREKSGHKLIFCAMLLLLLLWKGVVARQKRPAGGCIFTWVFDLACRALEVFLGICFYRVWFWWISRFNVIVAVIEWQMMFEIHNIEVLQQWCRVSLASNYSKFGGTLWFAVRSLLGTNQEIHTESYSYFKR